MLIQIPVPPSFAIVDPVRRMPRFWATAWSLTLGVKTRAKNTLKLKLRHVDAFYAFCDERFGLDSFDEALSTRDHDLVAQMLEAASLCTEWAAQLEEIEAANGAHRVTTGLRQRCVEVGKALKGRTRFALDTEQGLSCIVSKRNTPQG